MVLFVVKKGVLKKMPKNVGNGYAGKLHPGAVGPLKEDNLIAQNQTDGLEHAMSA